MRIAHLTSAHRRDDIRIVRKMCRSFTAARHDVVLIVADGQGNATVDGVHIVDTGPPRSRFDRMVGAAGRVARAGMATNADILHFHDPELIRFAGRLSKADVKIVLDAHENVEKQILSKFYLPGWSRKSIAYAYGRFEHAMLKYVDLTVGATPAITRKFVKRGARAVTVNNFPLLGELSRPDLDWSRKEPVVCYVGGMSTIRGATQLASAAALLNAPRSVQIAGGTAPASIKHDMAASGGKRLVFLGQLDRKEVKDLMARSCAGIVTFLPAPNHLDAQPNKMFEYMSAGLPVIASDFPLWREIIEGADCGILVDPEDPKTIATAINAVIDDPERAEAMGRNGQRAVHERYNWTNEFATLETAYEEILAA